MTEELEMIYDELKDSSEKGIFLIMVSKIREFESNAMMLSNVMVEYYGSMTPIQQVANVSTLDARTLQFQPRKSNFK